MNLRETLEKKFLTDDWLETSTAWENMQKDIDDIVDDFESRTCGNCKFYDIKKADDEGYCSMLENWYTEDFGCNEFEPNS